MCFFSPFSSINDEKIQLQVLQKNESQLATIVMFNLMIKKKRKLKSTINASSGAHTLTHG